MFFTKTFVLDLFKYVKQFNKIQKKICTHFNTFSKMIQIGINKDKVTLL